jgi:hypothetical protein
MPDIIAGLYFMVFICNDPRVPIDIVVACEAGLSVASLTSIFL